MKGIDIMIKYGLTWTQQWLTEAGTKDKIVVLNDGAYKEV